jgi:hypothetical protein
LLCFLRIAHCYTQQPHSQLAGLLAESTSKAAASSDASGSSGGGSSAAMASSGDTFVEVEDAETEPKFEFDGLKRLRSASLDLFDSR